MGCHAGSALRGHDAMSRSHRRGPRPYFSRGGLGHIWACATGQPRSRMSYCGYVNLLADLDKLRGPGALNRPCLISHVWPHVAASRGRYRRRRPGVRVSPLAAPAHRRPSATPAGRARPWPLPARLQSSAAATQRRPSAVDAGAAVPAARPGCRRPGLLQSCRVPGRHVGLAVGPPRRPWLHGDAWP
jgi:hypothetical protein